MSTHYLIKPFFVSLLLLLPQLALAQGGLEGLAVLDLIVTSYYILLIAGALGVVSALVFVFSGAKWSLYFSLLAALILIIFYCYSFFLFPKDLPMGPQFISPFQNHLMLLILLAALLISARKFRDDCTQALWFFTLNVSSILLTHRLLTLLAPGVPLGLVFQAVLIVLFTFFYARKMFSQQNQSLKKVMIQAGLINTLCFITFSIFSLLSLLHIIPERLDLMQILKIVGVVVPLGLVATLTLSSVTVFFTAKKQQQKTG